MLRKLIIIFLAITTNTYAQPMGIVVNGHAGLLANIPVALAQYSDYITKTPVVVAEAITDKDGFFTLRVPNGDVGEYFLYIGNEFHSLILEPEHFYELEIPDANGEHVYYPTETDTTLILYQISNLDYMINYFSVVNYEDFTTGRIKNKLTHFLDSLDKKFAFMNMPFFKQYKEYKMAELMTHARYKSMKTMYTSFLKGKPVLYQHPQYMEFFNNFYTGLMNEWFKQGGKPGLNEALKNGTPIDSLLIYISKDDLADDPALTELICIKGLFELYYLPGYDKLKIESLVNELGNKTQRQEIKNITNQFLKISGRLKPGKPATNFEAKDVEGNIHALKDYLNKPVYLTFFNPEDPASQREIPAIQTLYNDFKKDITFVSICTGCTYSALQSFVNSNKLKWTFLIADPALEGEYEVLSYPAAFLIDKEGNFVFSPANLPSQGISKQIYLYLKDQKHKIR